MPSTRPATNRATRPGTRQRAIWNTVEEVAIIFILATMAAGSVHLLNLVVDAALPDPSDRLAGEAVPVATSNASAAKPTPAPERFSAQFPSPTESVEPQPEAF